MGRKCMLGGLVLCLMLLNLNAMAIVNDPNIISGAVAVNGTAPEPLEVVGAGLQIGLSTHVDRTYVFEDVAHRSGIDVVKTAVDDKTDGDVEYEITVNKSGTIFLFIDNRVGDDNMDDPPTLGGGVMDWVDPNGFTPAGFSIIVNGGAMTAYGKTVTAGTYTLHEQNDGSSRVMYLVAAVPDDFNYPPEILNVPSSVQVEPGGQLVVDANVIDYFGDNVGVASYLWEQLDANPAASFSPDATSEDVTISFTGDIAVYTIRLTATDIDGGQSTKTIEVSVQIPTFAVTGYQQLTACNDSDKGPTSHYTTSVYHIRNYLGSDGTTTRRRVGFQRYDISALKQEGKMFANCYLTWDFKKRTTGKSVYVYAITEAQDDFNLSSSSAYWASVPGLKNDWPRGAEITMDTLDLPDLSPLLLAYEPASTGEWLDTPTSAALDEVMNADADGSIILMFISYDPESDNFDIEPYSISGNTEPVTGLKGVIIQGQVRNTIWASQPSPAVNTTANLNLSQLSWVNPEPTEEGATVTSDVYFGMTEPNRAAPDYGLSTLATGISDEFVTLAPGTLERNQTYYWVVDTHDSARPDPDPARGFVWSFNTNNAAPSVDPGAAQYVWLNNNGDPGSATVSIDATVTDDGYPAPYTLLWEISSGPEGASVVIDPNDQEDITLTLPATGIYVFKLSADDTDLTGSASVQITVEATPCDAAKAHPDYVTTVGDIVEDCYVDLNDFAAIALHWMECNSTLITIGGSCD